jgi:hypothetical protein
MKSFSAVLMLALPILACSSGSQIDPHAGKMIVPGRGTDEVRVGMSRQQAIDLLGEPEEIQEEGRWLEYEQGYGLTLHLDDLDRVSEIHFLKGFKGHLPSRIQLGSKTLDVYQAYGNPLDRREIPAGPDDEEDRVLYIMPEESRICYRRLGIAFRFSPVKRVTRMVVFQPLPDRSVRIKPMDLCQ